tara:strand:- start:270 stop:572 length:303 start_codon:yes stop_codon:yes gene_type:complete
MTEKTYNGFTNRETWLVNVHYRELILENVKNGETLAGNLEYVKESIKYSIDDLANTTSGMIQDMICSVYMTDKINWLELADYYTEELVFQAKTNAKVIAN